MTKFRFETIHLAMMGLIMFGLLAIGVKTVQSQAMLLLLILLVSLFVVSLLYYQKRSYEDRVREKVSRPSLPNQMDTKRIDAGLAELLGKMPVGVVLFSNQFDKVEWFNPYAQLIFSDLETGQFQEEKLIQFLAEFNHQSGTYTMRVEDTSYRAQLDRSAQLLYFYEYAEAPMINQEVEVSDQSPVIGILSIDNYDDAMSELSDADVSQTNSFIADIISEFATQYRIFYRRVDMDRFYIMTDYQTLEKLVTDEFSILKIFRTASQERQLPLTLSLGIAYGTQNHQEIGALALKNLNMALVRGGDQVVLKENDDQKDFLYFGGGSVSTVKRSRTRTRALMTAISDKLKTVSSVYIVGHKRLDMDALGAAVGMAHFAKSLVKKVHVVYDPDDMAKDIERSITALTEEARLTLTPLKKAMISPKSNALLIMVDHSKICLTLSEEFYHQFRDVIVIDHHRRDSDFPANATLSFIESGASSASELVTELIQFQASEKSLSSLESSLLMAGIMLDTRNFSKRVTSRSFDVASYLRTLGSDSQLIASLMATDFEDYQQINHLVVKAKRFGDTMIIANGGDVSIYSNVTASKAADILLAMSGIEASFVIFKNPEGQVGISARSRDKVNVQRLMEQFGGGGHFNLAACQIIGKTSQVVEEELMTSLKEQIKREE